MTHPIPPSIKLLSRSIPAAVAAQLLAVDPALFAKAPGLTLGAAFRLALRPLIEARHQARGHRRGVLRRAIASDRSSVASTPAEPMALAMKVTARQFADDLEAEADRLAAIDPAAARRLRKAAQAALDTVNFEVAELL